MNQKARTRRAVLEAAVELMREGKAPSVPDAAERALVSVATAYRYFPSAENLQAEASVEAMDFTSMGDEIDRAVEAAGPDAAARLDALVMSLGWRMIDDQLPFRTMAKLAMDRWFERGTSSGHDLVREGRRKRWIELVVEPLQATLTERERAALSNALAVSLGTEAMISLIDVAGLDADAAKQALLDTNRWLLAGALADAKKRERRKS